jgi:hypothetical protein
MTNRIAGKDKVPPPPRAPILRFCITRKEYKSTLLFAGDGLGSYSGNGRWLVGTGFRKGFPYARGCIRQTAKRRLPASVFPVGTSVPPFSG